MKSLTVVLTMMVVLGLAGGLQAVMALDQDFEGLPLGSLGTAGQGSTADVGGKWFAVNAAADPSIVQDPGDPNNNQCVRITGGQSMLAGYSVAAPIAAGTPFVLSFSVFPVGWSPTDAGSFYLYTDKFETLNPDSPTVAMHNYTVGYLVVWDGKMGIWRTVTIGLEKIALLGDTKDRWMDIKIHVKTWDAGDGYGRWDLWYNTNQGNGWIRADQNNPFSNLHDGANAVLFRPRMPSVGVLAYFDNVYISTEPLDCQDAILFAGGSQASDYNNDCVVDFPDLGAWAPAWLEQLSNGPVDWEYKWDCDELPADCDLWEPYLWSGSPGTGSVSGGIYTVSTMTVGTDLAYQTVEGIYDASYPVMVEWRARMESAIEQYTAMISFYDELYGCAYVGLRPGRYYEQPDGWSTYRMVTFLDEDGLADLRLYVKHADGTWWFEDFGEVYVDLESPVKELIYRDLFCFGDTGDFLGGDFQQDYLYWTQDEAAIESFLADLPLVPYDLTADGLINLEDFALLSSDWLVDIAP